MKNVSYFIGGLVFAMMIGLATAEAQGYRQPPVDPTVTNVTNVTNTSITAGLSTDELAAGMAIAMASGGHQFDFSTSDWQGSIVGAWQLGGADENAASVAVGKRFSDDFMPNTLFHFTYTPDGDDDWVMFGGTFRF